MPTTELLAHRPPMLLVDEVLNCSAEQVRTAVRLSADKQFCDSDGAPGWLALELIAQTAGCWIALRRRRRGLPRPFGYLVSARGVETPARFAADDRLIVTVRPVTVDDDDYNGVFDGSIVSAAVSADNEATVLARGRVTAAMALDPPAAD